jgi:AcrR family transcriptional regulator
MDGLLSEVWTPVSFRSLDSETVVTKPLRRHAAANRERILAAAEAVFGARGALGSTEDVAERAGVGIATVFRHFPTKEALIEAALLRHFERLIEQAGELGAQADPAEALHALLARMIGSGATKLTLASLVGVTVDELYVLIRGLAQATATAPAPAETLNGAIEIVWRGIAVTPPC